MKAVAYASHFQCVRSHLYSVLINPCSYGYNKMTLSTRHDISSKLKLLCNTHLYYDMTLSSIYSILAIVHLLLKKVHWCT